jgi:hypothetical protein
VGHGCHVKNIVILLLVIPAKAGIQFLKVKYWIPAFAGMTKKKRNDKEEKE